MAVENLVIVESPAKAKTINKYLGKKYKVIASMGHVRDLSPKEGSVEPEHNFRMRWEVSGRGEKQINDIAKEIQDETVVFLATDPDREGEAISWHLTEELKNRRKLGRDAPKRIVFHEITESAVTHAIQNPRALDQNLISAYLARRALDYLVGYSLSPILWRKLPGTKSAGRVQSVALRLIVEREMEIRNFLPKEYWSLQAELLVKAKDGKSVNLWAQLSHEDNKRLDRLAIDSEDKASNYENRIKSSAIELKQADSKLVRRHPAAPFTTSTLQQEASRKLGFSASFTMQVAQKLYEGGSLGGNIGGLITYMRTDSTHLSGQAIHAVRQYITKHYAKEYLPDSPRQYKTKAKNAQEAHEAIRPTDIIKTPESVKNFLKPEQLALYRLIWQRTLASQMQSASFNQTTVSFSADNGKLALTATGQIPVFDGFLILYQESKDDEEEAESKIIPELDPKQIAKLQKLEKNKHFTEPPPRYTEASLVKKMEEIGIGRPSTYANIIRVLQVREYVRLEKKRFFCENRGIVLSAFLTRYYDRYFNYVFTAKMEDELDDVSNGLEDWHELLKKFWQDFSQKLGESKDLLHANIQKELQQVLTDFIFGQGDAAQAKKHCQKCADGELTLQLGSYGPYLSCSNYPNCDYRSSFDRLALDSLETLEADGGMLLPKLLGKDNQGREVNLKKGPYGFYVELGLLPEAILAVTAEDTDSAKKEKFEKEVKKKKPKNKITKPKRSAIPKTIEPTEVDLDLALKLLSLPREIGQDPNTGEMIMGSIGPYGPYLKKGGNYYSLKGDDNVLEIGLNRAIDIIANAPKKKNEARSLGQHPDGGDILLKRGRWGYYLEWLKPNKKGGNQKKFAKLAAGTDAKNFTIDMALIVFPKKQEKSKTNKKIKNKSTEESE